jgi:hypothetical protein
MLLVSPEYFKALRGEDDEWRQLLSLLNKKKYANPYDRWVNFWEVQDTLFGFSQNRMRHIKLPIYGTELGGAASRRNLVHVGIESYV